MMTPIEIFEYKLKWQKAGGYSVRLHSDLRGQGRDFCKVMMQKQQWDLQTHTAVYEDTFWFEYAQDAKLFKEKFSQYADL